MGLIPGTRLGPYEIAARVLRSTTALEKERLAARPSEERRAASFVPLDSPETLIS